jgi:hypothetical protein
MTGILIVLAITIMVWFAAGSVVNVRKGHAAMRWLHGGLPLIGSRTTLRWLGTTSAQMLIAAAKPPIAQAEVVIFLEPRDSAWLWWISRRRGRRDTIIVRADLRRPPAERFELLDRTSWSGRDANRHLKHERWSLREPAAGSVLTTFYKFERSLAAADAVAGLAADAGIVLRRLAVSPAEPHLQLHADLPPASFEAATFFTALRGIADRVAGR